MDQEDREDYLRNPDDDKTTENPENVEDTRELQTENDAHPRVPEPRRTRRAAGARLDRPLIPKGYTTLLEPKKMSTEISAQELEWWTRQ